MNRTLNRTLLDQWLVRNGPDGITVLAYKSKVSASTILKARATKTAPKKLSTLQRLSEIVEIPVDELFPIVKSKGNKAS